MTNGLCSTCLFPLSMFQVCVLLVSILDRAIVDTYQCHCHPCRDFSTWAVVLSFCMRFLVLTDNPSCRQIFKVFCTKFFLCNHMHFYLLYRIKIYYSWFNFWIQSLWNKGNELMGKRPSLLSSAVALWLKI